MPSIDDLLDAEATRWRTEVDSAFAAASFTAVPAGRRPARRYAWVLSAAGTAAAVTAIVLATSGPSHDNRLAGPTGTSSTNSAPSNHTSRVVAPPGSASCVGPMLSFRNPFHSRHFRRVPTLTHPVRRGDFIRIFGAFFVSTCNDTGQGIPNRPIREVRLVMHTSAGQHAAVVVHPHGQRGRFEVAIRIPDDAVAGRATIHGDRAYGRLRFTIAD